MRILFINTLYEPNIVGGAERVVQTVAEGLVSMGHECVVITLGQSKEKEMRNINGVKVHYIPLRNLYWPINNHRPNVLRRSLWHAMDSYNPTMATFVDDILCDEEPDVVNTHTISGFSVAIWKVIKLRKLPLIHTLHDQYLLCPNSTMFKNGKNCLTQCGLCRLYGLTRHTQSTLPDIVTGVSSFILERHRQYGYFPDIEERVIYNSYERQGEIRPLLLASIDNRPLRFGFLGRLHKSKGIEYLVREFIGLPSEAVELWIGGHGENDYEANLKRLTSGKNNIRWLGFVEKEKLLSEVDIMVVPSLWHDTAPLAVIEALAWGKPIVASRRGGIPELVSENEGWLFEPDKIGSLRDVLHMCLENKADISEKSANAFSSASRFTKRAMLSGYLAAYQSVM